jgi:hypothetical protein
LLLIDTNESKDGGLLENILRFELPKSTFSVCFFFFFLVLTLI